MMELRRWRDFLGVPINIEPKFFPSSEALTTISSSRCVKLRAMHRPSSWPIAC